jgi:site-specific recombinase XerD
MTTKSINVDQILELYFEEIKANYSATQSERIINETRSAIFRILLPKLGFKRLISSRKMTGADVQSAEAYIKKITVLRLRKGRQLIAQALENSTLSQASRNTYGNRLEKFLHWTESQSWCPTERFLRIQDQCRPPRRLSGRRRVQDLPLTSRQGAYFEYSLPEAETPPKLQAHIDDLKRFMIDSYYPGRVLRAIKDDTSESYLKEIRLLLGYAHRYQDSPVALNELSFADLIPYVSEEDLEGLTPKQQKQLWREKQLQLEAWIAGYFKFIREKNASTSPRTQVSKLTALKRIAWYLYRHEVSLPGDYGSIPIFVALEDQIRKVIAVKKKWEVTRNFVANQDLKWPDPVEGETALTTLRRALLEPLRIQCRPRRKTGDFCEPFVIAIAHQHYLKWAFIADLPPRRQKAYRTTLIALSCPVTRPADVPADGCYFPLPPSEERKKNADGTLGDNYIYRVYSFKGKLYPEGIWVLELASYKTDEIYGIYSMLIPERTFEDGTTFYQHLDHYLCGWWMAEGKKHLQVYDWWDPELKGRRGKWVTAGRAEFDPKDSCEEPNRSQSAIWRSGYLFPVPTKGIQADANSFVGSFQRTSYQILGKNITPHMLRAMWATWAFQMNLSDAELRSLAYAMGHSVQTLRKIYERTTPEEKLRPIFEAIDRLLFQQLEEPLEKEIAKPNVLTLVESLRQLSLEERQQIFKLAEGF